MLQPEVNLPEVKISFTIFMGIVLSAPKMRIVHRVAYSWRPRAGNMQEDTSGRTLYCFPAALTHTRVRLELRR